MIAEGHKCEFELGLDGISVLSSSDGIISIPNKTD